MKIKDKLVAEIEETLTTMKEMEVGSDEYKSSIDAVTKLTDRVIEIEKLEVEHDDRVKEQETDLELKRKQTKIEKIDSIVKNGLSAFGIVLGTGVTIWGTLASFKFEQEGTITTIMGRGFIQRLLPKNKN